MRNRWILIGASLGVLWHGMAMGQVTVDNAGSVGQYTSLTVVNGNPAISYFDDDNDDLKYVRATDVDGSAWAVPVMVDGALENVGYYTSLSVVNGNPAISYWDVSNGDLKYVRATDANGSAWGAPVTADSGDYIGGWTSLTVVNGNPAISYFYGSTADLKYVQATDVNGSAWAVPLSVDSAEAVGEYTSLAVVNGNPAISYYDFTNSGLKYVRATDVNGSAWAVPLAVDSAGAVGEYTSLTVVNGNPAISYFYGSTADLKYVRATDVNGSAWAVPLAVDSAEAVGEYTSLAVVNGNPAVSYYDSTNGDLKYWRGSSEINLKQGVTDIADGGTYDFGSQNLGTNTNVTFTIENTGSLNLTITTPIAIGGADAGQFSVQQQPVSPVAPSGTTTFIIRFSPTSLGAKTASISIANNDGDENPYDLAITGTGGSSEINLKQGVTDIADGGTYNFGSQNLGTNTNVTFTIENTGSLNLTITTPIAIGGADAGQFSVQQQPVSPVAPSGTTTFIIRFSPTSLGAKTASISIANNDGDENPYDLTIQGAGGNVPATSIPAMNEWGMIILFLLITGMALWGILRKKAEC